MSQELVKKEFKSYSNKIREFEKFLKENEALILKYHALEEETKVAEFTAREKIDMFIEEGKVVLPENKKFFMEDDLIELRINMNKRAISFFQKKLYNLNNLPKTK